MQSYIWANSRHGERCLWHVNWSLRVQNVFQVGVRMRTCLSSPQSLLLQFMSFHWLQRTIISLSWNESVGTLSSHPSGTQNTGTMNYSVTRTVSGGDGGGNEETSHQTSTIIPQRLSDGNSLFLLWTGYMLCSVPLSGVSHFVLSRPGKNSGPAELNMERCNKKYSLAT